MSRGFRLGDTSADRPVTAERGAAVVPVAQAHDRTPDEALVDATTNRVARMLTSVAPRILDVQVCSWTDSPDHRFVIDRLPDGIVVAFGDSGEGFKFSALMGILLADLAEGRTPDADVATFGAGRFAAGVDPSSGTEHALGR